LREHANTSADGEGFDAISVSACPANTLPQSQNQGEAESEAVCPDSELKAVVDAWPTLPTAIKAGILAMIGTTAKGQK
jgi:hypothetical protein